MASRKTPARLSFKTPILFVATTNAKRSRAFYEKSLGLKFVSEDGFALVFKVGALMLRVQKVAQKPALGSTVLGWMVSDIRKEVRRLSEAGVRFSRYEGLGQDEDGVWHSPSGAKIAWFTDPDENILSLTEFG